METAPSVGSVSILNIRPGDHSVARRLQDGAVCAYLVLRDAMWETMTRIFCQTKEAIMSKRARKKRDRKRNNANHGKRPLS
ncbi:hypothetical protein GCM10027562_31480 [Arthrobacter pigmenti]